MPDQIAAPADTARASDLITALRDRAPRASLALAAAQAAWPAIGKVRGLADDFTTYTVKVSGDDDLYDDLHEWVLGLLPPGRQRALIVSSGRGRRVPVSDKDQGAPPELRYRYDGSRSQSVRIAGHRISVSVTETIAHKPDDWSWTPPSIVFTARTATARRALLGEIALVADRSHAAKRKPAVRMLDQWGDWQRLDDLPARDLASVVLPERQLDRITEDIARFLAAEADYGRRCIPWHRGHLYEGPPGTGKTSAAIAVAAHFGMDVWLLPLADLRKDSSLMRLVARITPRSMLLLEDADVFHAATERDDDQAEKVTLSGLLNSLDGLATPHGLVTVMTTNKPKALDDALIRPGRADLTETFGLAESPQVRMLMSRYYGCHVEIGAISGISPAAVIEACKRHDDPAQAVADLSKMVPL